MFLRLTHTQVATEQCDSGKITSCNTVWINMDRIAEFYSIPEGREGGAALHVDFEGTVVPIIVDETPELIVQMLSGAASNTQQEGEG